MKETLEALLAEPCVDCGEPIGFFVRFPCSRCPACDAKRTGRIHKALMSGKKLTFKLQETSDER